MKKIISIILVLSVVFALAACGGKEENKPAEDSQSPENGAVQEPGGELTMGQTLKNVFLNKTAEGITDVNEIAAAIMESPVIEFEGGCSEVAEGYLPGFSEDILGFESGVMFGPFIGSIAFVGYVFQTADEAAAEELCALLEEKADPRWNICVEAQETVIESEGSLVFFLMCP